MRSARWSDFRSSHPGVKEDTEPPYTPNLVVSEDMGVAIISLCPEIAVLRCDSAVNKLHHFEPYAESAYCAS